jgi:LDH2 family malate/lactate/ureidoglycolate dehydrogenase
MRIVGEKLKKAITNLLQTLGAKVQEARLVADVLVEADMRGISTHGCAFVPLIAERHAHAPRWQ